MRVEMLVILVLNNYYLILLPMGLDNNIFKSVME